MPVEISTNPQKLRDTFTVSANCAGCAQKVVDEIHDLAECGLGSDMIVHTLGQIDPSKAIIRNADGVQINGRALAFDRI